MAKRSRRAAAPTGEATPADAVERGAEDVHLVVVQIADGAFGFRLADVAEIVRLPRLAHMPLAPRSLLGLANLRGAALPVVSVRRLLGLPDAPLDAATRLIVMGRGAPVAFVVDRINKLASLPSGQIEADDTGAGTIDPDLVDGVVKGAEGQSTIKILNPVRLLRDEFSRLGAAPLAAGPRVAATGATANAPSAPAEQVRHISLISFVLAGQEYALPLDCVREIIPLPDHVSEVARSETAVLGVVTLRDRLLALVSLRALLGLPSDVERRERGKVVVLSIGGSTVGMVADRTREILRVDPGLMDPAPALLTRGAGDAEITAICRLEQGRRLVAVLSPDRLFRSELMPRVLTERTLEGTDAETKTDGNAMSDEQFIIFRLGDQEYGLPIAAVEEIARRPAHIARMPKAPGFIDGVMNLRGVVVPIIDLRRRFDLPAKEPEAAQRILVLAVRDGKAGFMVDNVSEVLKVAAEHIRPAPDLSQEQMRLIGRVANLDAPNADAPRGDTPNGDVESRMILLVDPVNLLDQIETDALARFERGGLALAAPS
jgi:purine-binding chemotaxis protein CheW